jgi:hypothetical protein
MLKKILIGFAILVLIAIGFASLTVGRSLYNVYLATSPGTAPEDYAQQEDSRVQIPAQRGLEPRPFNRFKNVYWVDLHVHTVESFDAVLFGTTATVEDAYRFAKGEKLRSPGGELMQLSRPLDFVAITDHAESFGLRTRCGEPDLNLVESLNCWLMETPNILAFALIGCRLVSSKVDPGPAMPAGMYRNRSRTHPQPADFPICPRGEGGLER